jgi:predicted RecB family endonuclease
MRKIRRIEGSRTYSIARSRVDGPKLPHVSLDQLRQTVLEDVAVTTCTLLRAGQNIRQLLHQALDLAKQLADEVSAARRAQAGDQVEQTGDGARQSSIPAAKDPAQQPSAEKPTQ